MVDRGELAFRWVERSYQGMAATGMNAIRVRLLLGGHEATLVRVRQSSASCAICTGPRHVQM